jgi:Cu+-exporting ATPase
MKDNSGIFSDLELGDQGPDTSSRQVVNEVNVIKICTVVITGMTCAVCQNTIQSHLLTIEGVQDCFISLLTHKGSITYKPKQIGIRDIINEIEDLGFGATYEARQDKSDIRTILNDTVARQRRKFLLCLAI